MSNCDIGRGLIDRDADCKLGVQLGVDTEFFHSREESSAVHSQPRGSTIGAPDTPFAFGKCPYDLVALLSCILISNVRALIVFLRFANLSCSRLIPAACIGDIHVHLVSEFSERSLQ